MKVTIANITGSKYGELPAFELRGETAFEEDFLRQLRNLGVSGTGPKLNARWCIEGHGILVGVCSENDPSE